MNLMSFTCPNRAEDFVWVPSAGAHSWRTGYYLMAGRWERKYVLVDGRRLRSPMRPSESSKLILATELVEQGTIHGTIRELRQSSGPHGPRGLVAGLPSRTPAQLGSQGGNVAYLDGSVSFVQQPALKRHAANTNASVVGFWPEIEQQ
jgi:prepilin-type processing-associated H-X9-DG protein